MQTLLVYAVLWTNPLNKYVSVILLSNVNYRMFRYASNKLCTECIVLSKLSTQAVSAILATYRELDSLVTQPDLRTHLCYPFEQKKSRKTEWFLCTLRLASV